MRDYYAVLGVPEDASQEEIKEAFRKRALECHPDRAANGEEAAAKEEFVQVREAFELLSDPEKRAAYDAAEGEEETSAVASDDQETGRRRSYKEAWRARQGTTGVGVSHVILDQVQGLSADYDVLRKRTSITVPICGGLGTLFYLYAPTAIYATDVFLVDLFLCTAIGAIYGYLVGSAWGYVDLLFRETDE